MTISVLLLTLIFCPIQKAYTGCSSWKLGKDCLALQLNSSYCIYVFRLSFSLPIIPFVLLWLGIHCILISTKLILKVSNWARFTTKGNFLTYLLPFHISTIDGKYSYFQITDENIEGHQLQTARGLGKRSMSVVKMLTSTYAVSPDTCCTT